MQNGYKTEMWSVDDKRIWHGRTDDAAWSKAGEDWQNLYVPKVLFFTLAVSITKVLAVSTLKEYGILH